MHINTTLNKQDYITAYKNMFAFIAKRPLIMALVLMLCGGVTAVPFAMFPVKMAGFAIMVALVACIVTTQYRTGSLANLIAELQFQQRLLLPAVLAVAALSWLGFIVADVIIAVFSQSVAEGQSAIQASQAQSPDSTTVIAAVIAATLICLAQVMPLVLALFCHGMEVSKDQGEQIWLKLVINMRTFAAFFPIAQLVPVAIIFAVDLTGLMVLLGAMYSTFLLFIVFNIQPKSAEKASSLSLVEQV